MPSGDNLSFEGGLYSALYQAEGSRHLAFARPGEVRSGSNSAAPAAAPAQPDFLRSPTWTDSERLRFGRYLLIEAPGRCTFIPSFRSSVPAKAQQVIKFARALAARPGVKSWYMVLSRIYRASVTHSLGLHVDDPFIRVIRRPDGADILQVGGPYAKFETNLAMSDEALTEMFHLWLTIARKQVPSPHSTRGPKALNTYLDKRTFAGWRNARIVEYAYLSIWSAKLSSDER